MLEYRVFYNLEWGPVWKIPKEITIKAESADEAAKKAKTILTEKYSKLKSYKGKWVDIVCVQNSNEWDFEGCAMCGKCPKGG